MTASSAKLHVAAKASIAGLVGGFGLGFAVAPIKKSIEGLQKDASKTTAPSIDLPKPVLTDLRLGLSFLRSMGPSGGQPDDSLLPLSPSPFSSDLCFS
jgi:hypothetical protein